MSTIVLARGVSRILKEAGCPASVRLASTFRGVRLCSVGFKITEDEEAVNVSYVDSWMTPRSHEERKAARRSQCERFMEALRGSYAVELVESEYEAWVRVQRKA